MGRRISIVQDGVRRISLEVAGVSGISPGLVLVSVSLIIALGLFSGTAAAQPAGPSSPQPPRAATPVQSPETRPRPLDPGVEDVGPLSLSLRDMQIDLRQPVGFQNVYSVPGRDGMLMRSSGALHAVFPQSVYVQTRSGEVPLIPPGTTFHIGTPSPIWHGPQVGPSAAAWGGAGSSMSNSGAAAASASGMAGAGRDAQIASMLNASLAPPPRTRVSAYLPPAVVDQRAGSTSNDVPRPVDPLASMNQTRGPAIALDEQYRARRIEQLLEQAAAAQTRDAESEPQMNADER